MNEKYKTNFELFKKNYEILAGKVYFAATQDETVKVIQKIVANSKLSKTLLAPNLKTFHKQLKLLTADIEVTVLNLSESDLAPRINEADIGISLVDFAIAETGTIVEVSTDDTERLISSLPIVHIALLHASKIIRSLEDAAPRLRKIYAKHNDNCNITFISGPSRTADIEMKLFLGVHGPQESHVIVREWK